MGEESRKVALPGRIYQKKKRWWWNVRLPGEQKAKARALKPAGSRLATTEREVAEEIALEMWQLAIRGEIEAKVKAEAEQKIRSCTEEIEKVKTEAAETIARLKAEFEEKVRTYSEAVARAEEKAKAEAEARAQVEAKLNEVLAEPTATGACECCGREDVPENDLARIDSGQMLCPDCIKQLRG